ncbi:hypothetical protein JMJ35_005986 [Cladonia borealis]|uniref:Zn(2)-C6 fungal-type domain-containing protein n=1 Tax=Cladonia borealis TaxID=184061 RepID=A0AA39QYA8_9LECA|nr:hypothetical protein JMJ35_005986 [Cladonia borealis]
MTDQTDLECVSPTISAPIRKSCYFCRSRKIRCSGGQVCTACRARNMDCVYGREASKGRPRGSKSASASLKGALQKELGTASLPDSPRDQTNDDEATLSSLIHFPLHQTSSRHWPTPSKIDFSNTAQRPSDIKDRLVATALEDIFRHKFQEDVRPVQTAEPVGSSLLSEYDLQYPVGHHRISDTRKGSCFDARFGSCPPNSPLLSLSQDLVELASKRFGSLGSFQREDTSTDFVSTLLTLDEDATMFENDTEPESLLKYSDHQLYQMIELWVFHHPLSFLVSKTLLLHSYRNETHDQSLFAVVLGGACLALGDAESTQGHRFFHWADIQLRRRKADSPSISTVQTLILLGWYELCGSNARRALCYVELARISLKDIKRRCDDTPRTDIDWINGIDVGKVELELCQRMYWLTYALDLWAAMHMNVSFDVQTAPDTNVTLPPVEKNVSAVYILDERSGNSAALRQQEKAMHELWPLSHVASTIGHIYALYPRQAAAVPTSPVPGWESQILPRFRQLVDRPCDFSFVCQSIRFILSDGIDAFLAQMGGRPSDFFVLSAYRILIVHLFFPRSDPGVTTEIIADAISDGIVHSVGAFKNHAESLCRPPSDGRVTESNPAESSLLVLGLDTCRRALHQLYISLKSNMKVEEDWSTSRRDELTELAKGLHRICKYPRLRTASTLPMVKKHLKRLIQDIEPSGSPNLVENCLLRPADSFLGWFPPAPDPQIVPMSWTSGFDIPDGFSFNGIATDGIGESGNKSCNCAGSSGRTVHF